MEAKHKVDQLSVMMRFMLDHLKDDFIGKLIVLKALVVAHRGEQLRQRLIRLLHLLRDNGRGYFLELIQA